MLLGKCRYCSDGFIEVRDKEVRGRKVKLYACTNAHWKTEDGEMFETREGSTCSFRIWQNALAKYGKHLSYKEVRGLLENGTLQVTLLSKKYGKNIYYDKDIVLDQEYGISVLWETCENR